MLKEYDFSNGIRGKFFIQANEIDRRVYANQDFKSKLIKESNFYNS